MATLPPLKLDDKPLMRVYKGTRSRPTYSGPTYGVPAGALSGGSEDYYQDEDGKEITGFDPKLHSVYGIIGEGGKRVPNDPTVNSDPDTLSGLLNTRFSAGGRPMYPMSMQSGNPKAATPSSTTPKAATPTATTPADAVRASAAGPAPQLSIAEQQAADIRKSGGMTASDFDRENVAIGNAIYKEGYGVDITTPEGRLKSRKDAYERIRPNALQGAGVREFKRPDGSTGAYSTLPDAIIPESTANGHSGTTYRERAYRKHFETPEPTDTSTIGASANPIRNGGNWVGNNPVTGEFKDPEGNIWTSEKAFRNSQLGESGLVETDGIPMSNTPYTPTDEEVVAGKAAGQNYENLTAALAGNERRVRALQGKTGVIGADGKRAVQSIEPTMSTEDYVRQGINMEAENKDSKVPASWNNWNEKTGGNVNGVWMSPADSEPEAGGNYGNPALINTWTPEAGGRFNGVNMSRADSEPEAGGNYGNPLLIPSKTRPILAPSRAALLGPRSNKPSWSPYIETSRHPDAGRNRARNLFKANAPYLKEYGKTNYDTRGYNGQM